MNKPKYIYKDSHVHTTISHDGKSSISDYLEVASSKCVDEITFTEHYDVYTGVDSKLKTIDVGEYQKKYLDAIKGVSLRTNFGIEIGLRPECADVIKKMTSSYEFDFIIGSNHITKGKDMSMDKSFFEGLTMQEAYSLYFEDVLNNIYTYDDFDVYGHLDYVVCYGGYGCAQIEYVEYKKYLDEILGVLAKRGKGIEINTSGYRYGLGYPHPNMGIVERFIELGGKIITIGSDAHTVDHLASGFENAYCLMKKVGIKNFAVFHGRNPKFIEV